MASGYKQADDRVHYCLDYILMDYPHLDYRRLEYKDICTIPIWLLSHSDYQNLDYTPNRLHCHLDYIRLDSFGLLNVSSNTMA